MQQHKLDEEVSIISQGRPGRLKLLCMGVPLAPSWALFQFNQLLEEFINVELAKK